MFPVTEGPLTECRPHLKTLLNIPYLIQPEIQTFTSLLFTALLWTTMGYEANLLVKQWTIAKLIPLAQAGRSILGCTYYATCKIVLLNVQLSKMSN